MRQARPHPARTVTLAFLGAITVGTALLLLPVSRAGPDSPSLLTAFFTATSAVTTSGMSTVDTATYWSTFGHVLLAVLTQAGGFGITTIATLAGLLVSQQLGLRGRMLGVIVGGIGVPVLYEILRQSRRPAAWSTHTWLTVGGTLVLLVVGFAAVLGLEWGNDGTLGPLSVPGKILAAFVQGTIPRSGGFNTVDYGAMNEDTSAIIVGLMFIGGGSASTAGGIKVTTFFLLAYVIWTEVRGERDVVVVRRRIAESTQRQATTVALLGVATVATGTLVLLAITTGIPFDRALFEVMSAFSTSGLTTGLTAELSAAGQLILSAMMFIGRVGTVAVASALALNTRHRQYRYPEERPIVG